MHLGAVCPGSDVAGHGRLWVGGEDGAIEATGFLLLVDDDPVVKAPPDVQGDTVLGELPDVGDGTSQRVCTRRGRWCAAYLEAGERLQPGAAAGDPPEGRVAGGHVGGGVEGGGACEKAGMKGGQEQRFLSAHAAADGIDAARVDSEPGQCGLEDPRHACEVVDLAAPAPRVQGQATSLPFGVDDG